MTPKQRSELKAALLALRAELTGKGPLRIDPNRTDEARVGGDEDEQPLNEMLQSIASKRNKTNEGVLRLVDKALQKLAESPDDYGLCEACDEDIAAGRLKAMPYADLCVACQGKRDGPKGGPTRKKLTDYE